MRFVGYAYPWDYVGDPRAAERAANLGLDAVAVAASYHAVRGTCPLHPSRRVYEISNSAFYLPVHDTAWRGHALVPRAAVGFGEDAFDVARRALADVELACPAWIVLNHVDRFDAPEECFARNAFDNVYRYALCPSCEDVREYGLTLINEVITATDCPGVVLEALGPMGFTHGGAHDKTGLAGFSAEARELLSLCNGDACRRGYRDAGIDVDELNAWVRRGVDAASSVVTALGTALADAVSSYRSSVVNAYLCEVTTGVQALGRDTTITLHASVRHRTSGSFTELLDATA